MSIETTTGTDSECSVCAAPGVCSNCDGTGEGSDGRDCGRCGSAGVITVEHCCVCEHAVSEYSDYQCACED